MRKILSVVAALLLLAVTHTNAEVKQQLTISGATVDAVVTRITFNGDNVVLHFTGGDSQTADMDAVVLWALHETFGFGADRLKKYYTNFIKKYQELQEYF